MMHSRVFNYLVTIQFDMCHSHLSTLVELATKLIALVEFSRTLNYKGHIRCIVTQENTMLY